MCQEHFLGFRIIVVCCKAINTKHNLFWVVCVFCENIKQPFSFLDYFFFVASKTTEHTCICSLNRRANRIHCSINLLSLDIGHLNECYEADFCFLKCIIYSLQIFGFIFIVFFSSNSINRQLGILCEIFIILAYTFEGRFPFGCICYNLIIRVLIIR